MEREQVHMRPELVCKAGEGGGLLRRVIDSGEHDVLDAEAARVAANAGERLPKLREGVAPSDGHDPRAGLLDRRVEAESQPDLRELLDERRDLRRDPHGGHRDPPRAELEPLRRGEGAKRGREMGPVVKRLSHPHEDDLGHGAELLLPHAPVDVEPLPEDLRGVKVPREAKGARRAEAAGRRAADLAGDAEGPALSARDPDRLDRGTIRQPEPELPGPVGRDLHQILLERLREELCPESLPKCAGERGHGVRIGATIEIELSQDLLTAVPGFTLLREPALEEATGLLGCPIEQPGGWGGAGAHGETPPPGTIRPIDPSGSMASATGSGSRRSFLRWRWTRTPPLSRVSVERRKVQMIVPSRRSSRTTGDAAFPSQVKRKPSPCVLQGAEGDGGRNTKTRLPSRRSYRASPAARKRPNSCCRAMPPQVSASPNSERRTCGGDGSPVGRS
jgi:hypothetical protein